MPKEVEVIMPYEPSDEVAQWMSNLGFGFSNGERIADGVKNYQRIRSIMFNEQRIERERIATDAEARATAARVEAVLRAQGEIECPDLKSCIKGVMPCSCAAMGK